MATLRLINKYPNRRLYDTGSSCYITLEDVRRLVIAGEDFTVVDKRSGRDITRSILLQIISDQEEGSNPIFRTRVLRHIIRFYGDSMQGAMSSYLELSLDFFNEQQQQFRGRLKSMLDVSNPITALRELTPLQRPIWKNVRREVLANLRQRRDAADERNRTDDDA
ncbi:polyhydroxyalkanoate synthesis repressor PhaR [Salinisphaera sp. USBA-960]|uniref:polyhydroxyalkanoate synthesis repressor PhaR n=1 Tax=Salinisphaera orenii TaxID=856731 RepID=UPI000DBE6C14|nr:polyhydroxyalkanoate synthesis repressor PhaR [Salifodinibacter halophilus]NNC25544.1 polyhydroxyalkanoate synthesis repressor PhaR [Salifodinibacter halophilus]